MFSFNKIAMTVVKPFLLLIVGVALLGASLPCNCCKTLQPTETINKLAGSSPCHSNQSKQKNNESSDSSSKSCCCSIANITDCKIELATTIGSELSIEKTALPLVPGLHPLPLLSNFSLDLNHVRGSPLVGYDLIVVRSSALPIRFQRLVI